MIFSPYKGARQRFVEAVQNGVFPVPEKVCERRVRAS